jgi:hypothetical protein
MAALVWAKGSLACHLGQYHHGDPATTPACARPRPPLTRPAARLGGAHETASDKTQRLLAWAPRSGAPASQAVRGLLAHVTCARRAQAVTPTCGAPPDEAPCCLVASAHGIWPSAMPLRRRCSAGGGGGARACVLLTRHPGDASGPDEGARSALAWGHQKCAPLTSQARDRCQRGRAPAACKLAAPARPPRPPRSRCAAVLPVGRQTPSRLVPGPFGGTGGLCSARVTAPGAAAPPRSRRSTRARARRACGGPRARPRPRPRPRLRQACGEPRAACMHLRHLKGPQGPLGCAAGALLLGASGGRGRRVRGSIRKANARVAVGAQVEGSVVGAQEHVALRGGVIGVGLQWAGMHDRFRP